MQGTIVNKWQVEKRPFLTVEIQAGNQTGIKRWTQWYLAASWLRILYYFVKSSCKDERHHFFCWTLHFKFVLELFNWELYISKPMATTIHFLIDSINLFVLQSDIWRDIIPVKSSNRERTKKGETLWTPNKRDNNLELIWSKTYAKTERPAAKTETKCSGTWAE